MPQITDNRSTGWSDLPQDMTCLILDFAGQDAQSCLYAVNRALRTLVMNYVSEWYVSSARGFRFTDNLKFLSRLTICLPEKGSFTKLHVLTLAHKPTLTYLKIDRTHVAGNAWGKLAECASLSTIKFRGTEISDASLDAFAHSKTLISLSLIQCGRAVVMSAARAFRENQSLTSLSLREQKHCNAYLYPFFDRAALLSWSSSKVLVSLDIRGHRVHDDDLRTVQSNKALRFFRFDRYPAPVSKDQENRYDTGSTPPRILRYVDAES